MHAHFYTADVFTSRRFGGNQLAVFPDARAIPEANLLPITREFNYSEVTFVYPPADRRHTRRVRIFTPGGEIPFAGHPTVGTAHVLVATGEIPNPGGGAREPDAAGELRLVLEEGVGPVPVLVRTEQGEPTFAQLSVAKLPEVVHRPHDVAALADVLSLDPGDLVGGAYAPEAVSSGIPFLLVPLASFDAVRRARVRLDLWEQTVKGTPSSEMMVFATTERASERASAGATGGADVHARVFVPGLSVPEDPATGSACAALGGYLAARTPRDDATLRWTVAQGVEMGRPSTLHVEADKAGGQVTAVRVGGNTVLVSEGRMRVD
jgi:trans-2,3-dihydro-3-hydroxyanthranilate isomerase